MEGSRSRLGVEVERPPWVLMERSRSDVGVEVGRRRREDAEDIDGKVEIEVDVKRLARLLMEKLLRVLIGRSGCWRSRLVSDVWRPLGG